MSSLVTVETARDEAISDSVKSVMDSRRAVGGGFLCFNASSSKATHNESSVVSTSATDKTINIKIPGAQILGWFCEFNPQDQSAVITSDGSSSSGDLDIVRSVEALEQLSRPEEPLTVKPDLIQAA